MSTISASASIPVRLGRALSGLPRLLLHALLLGWALLRYGLRVGPVHRRSIQRAFARRALLARERAQWRSPLHLERGCVYKVDPTFLAGLPAAESGTPALPAGLAPAVVVHFTGTGETRHGPLASLAHVIGYAPELRALEHYIVDAPEAAAAYGSPLAFAERIWTDLAPLLESRPGPFLFIGLSRGALAALELGARTVAEQKKVVAVLAQSPPFVRPAHMPPAIELIGSLEALVTLSLQQLELFPSPGLQRSYLRTSKPMQTLLTACVLAELGIDDEPNQTLAMRDLVHDEPLAASLRSVREFAMLMRVMQPELTSFADKLGEVMARDRRLSVAIAWGERDPWTPADRNRALVEQALARAAASDAGVSLHVLPGVGHAFCRHPQLPVAELRAIMKQLLAETEAKLAAH